MPAEETSRFANYCMTGNEVREQPAAGLWNGPRKRIAFVSTMNSAPWGGSELLWSRAALHLLREGHSVSINVCGWPNRVPDLSRLADEGASIKERGRTPDRFRSRLIRILLELALRGSSYYGLARWLSRQRPDLVCISNAVYADNEGFMSLCMRYGAPYVLICQANSEHAWPDDSRAGRVIEFYRHAKRSFFVSKRNRALLEAQLGVRLINAEVVWNPVNIRSEVPLPWPAGVEPVRLACVARLEPASKGQDLLLQVLASEPWTSRPLCVSFYGKGGSEKGVRRLAGLLGLCRIVRFCGHIDNVEEMWKDHHALVLPSRYEGLPIAAVEAMFCGRPAILTDVAGNTEIVEDGVTGYVAEAPTVRHLNIAMQRAWENRSNWEMMGKTAAKAIRRLMPADPAADFAGKLLRLAAG